MHHVFIFNPQAGKSKAEQTILPEAIEAAKKANLEYSIHRTVNVGEATSFVSRMLQDHPEDEFRFYAIGGDGTINEVATGMLGHDNAELAVIPCGSGNDFVKLFGDKKYFYNMEGQFNGTAYPVDLIRVNGSICVNMINIGLDSHTAEFQQTLKATTPLRGTASYVAAFIKELAANDITSLRLVFDDGSVKEGDFFMLSVGNGGFCGGGFHSCPRASVNDGIMDVCLVKQAKRSLVLQLAGEYYKGTFLNNPKAEKIIEYKKTKSLIIEVKSNTPICNDGEIFYEKELDMDVLPSAIRFVVPEGATFPGV